MILYLTRLELAMVWVTLGVNKKNVSKFSLSYYSLTTQIIIINFFTAIIILIFVGVFNLFLLKNNKSIEQKTQEITIQINDIKNYLQKNAIFRIPQFNEKNGEVCPANWSEGSDGMKPDPKGSQEYFSKHN